MLRIGIIGCGAIANFHAKAIENIEESVLVGGADARPENAERFAKEHHCRAFATVEELLACEDIDAVCVCTPSGLHAKFVIMAANAKKHVLTEKPVATTLADADAMIAACEQNGVKLGVVSQLRFAPGVQQAKKAIDSGKLGKIVVGDVAMKYYREASYFLESPWRGTWALNGGGALINQGIHGIDLLLYLVGKVKSVNAICKTMVHNIEVEDTAGALIEFENGALGTVTGTTSVYPGIPRRLNVNGTCGSITLVEESISAWDIKGEERPDEVKLCDNVASGAGDAMSIEVYGHVLQHRDFAKAIAENRRPLVDGYEARRALELVCAIYESNRTGKTVYLG